MTTEEILLKYKPQKDNLLLILHEIQNSHPQQYIPKDEMAKVAEYLNLTMASVYGVVGYYSMFSKEARGKYVIRCCDSPVCNMMGSQKILEKLKEILGTEQNETSKDGLFTLESCECLGLCGNKPSLLINEMAYKNLEEESIEKIINDLRNQ